MNEIKHEHRILEAIDQLRRRKARPDADRICSYMQRRFGVSPADSISDLQRLVEADIVVRVEYKGNTSYRNAAKWSRYAMYSKSREENQGVNQSLSSLVSSGIAELIVQEPDYLDFGVPRQELKKFLYEKDRTLFTDQHFDIIVQREVGSGNLVILENGNYSLADHPIPTSPSPSNSNGNELKMLKIDSPTSSDHHSDDDYISKEEEIESNFNATYYVNIERREDPKKLDSSPDAETSLKDAPSSGSGFRVGVRRKRAKKVFDPSDNNVPSRRRGRPLGSTSAKLGGQGKSVSGLCCLCHLQSRNKRGQNEKLIACKDCTNKVHPSCANLTEFSDLDNWLCSHCKTCSVCSGTSDLERMVVCGGCDEAFHTRCRPAPLLEHASSAKWFCNNCSATYMKTAKTDTEAHKDVACETRAIDAVEAKICSTFVKMEEDEEIDERVPDASCWSVEQVFKYLSDQGFPEEAAIFKHHGIDGPSLLLMKRDDVLIELSLKLGPALKLYKQVKKLQIRRCEDYFFWP